MVANILTLELVDTEKESNMTAQTEEVMSICVSMKPAWIGRLFLSIWSNASMSEGDKLSALDEAEKAWPFTARVIYHKWRFQFKNANDILNVFVGEPAIIKSIVEDIITLYGKDLEDLSRKLWAIRAAISSEDGLREWMKREFQIIPYDALFYGGNKPSRLTFGLEWRSKTNSAEAVTHSLSMELEDSPGLWTFLRLVTGDNNFGEDGETIELVGQKLNGKANGLECVLEKVDVGCFVTESLFGDVEAYCGASSVWMHALDYDGESPITIQICFYHNYSSAFAVPVGRVTSLSLPHSLDLSTGSLTITNIEILP